MAEALLNRARGHLAEGDRERARRDAERVQQLAGTQSPLATQAVELLRSLDGTAR